MLSPRKKSPPTIILDSRVIGGVVASAVLLAVLAFLVGRWSAGGPPEEPGAPQEAAAAVEEDGEPTPIPVRQSSIEQELSFLERVERERREGPGAIRGQQPTREREEEPSGEVVIDPRQETAGEESTRRGASPSREREPPASPPPAADARGYLIQVFATEHQSRAEAMRRRLAGKGYPVSIVTTQVQSKTYYRVRVGPYAQRSRADAVADRLKRQENLSIWIIKP